MNDDEFEKEKSRWLKEFVYDQWRKILTIFVIGDDVSRNGFNPTDVTSEKIRTVFDNGYKMAMLQTKKSLMKELFNEEDWRTIKILERIMSQIDDRLESQKCFNLYKNDGDKSLLVDAKKRDEEFSIYLKSDMTEWADRHM
jgi:hypothetical protein